MLRWPPESCSWWDAVSWSTTQGVLAWWRWAVLSSELPPRYLISKRSETVETLIDDTFVHYCTLPTQRTFYTIARYLYYIYIHYVSSSMYNTIPISICLMILIPFIVNYLVNLHPFLFLLHKYLYMNVYYTHKLPIYLRENSWFEKVLSCRGFNLFRCFCYEEE